MAAITITAANVGIASNVPTESGIAGETVTHGLAAYKASDGKWYKASKASLVASQASGIFMGAASADEPVLIVTGDGKDVKYGTGVFTVGATYAVGASGAIIPIGDLTTGDWKTLIGTARTSSVLRTKFDATGVQLP
jgi:hypothetical protein